MIKTKHFDYARSITRTSNSGGMKIISKKEVAKQLGVSLSTVYRMNKAGELPPPLKTHTGRIRGWFHQSLEEWLSLNGYP